MCLLVVVNLLFVHVTGVVEVGWVLTFAALTLLAPLLRHCTESAAYRLAWSIAVLALFVALVHRTLVQGVGRMLEGGLILAVFCQVHLVNNIGARQRPDLLLFNSFLIALITAFFCQELVYCAVFVVYAFTLLTVWRVLAHRETGGNAPLGTVLAQGGRHALLVLVATGAVFLFWPRDFDRQGFVGERLLAAGEHLGGDDEIRLANKLAPMQSDKVVMRIRSSGGVPAHWRGATFSLLEAGAWHATTMTQEFLRGGHTARTRSLDPLWYEEGRGRWRRPAGPLGGELQVELLDVDRGRLYLPEGAAALTLHGNALEVPHVPLADGTFALFGDDLVDGAGALAYQVACADELRRPPAWTPERLEAWLGLDPRSVPSDALALAQSVRAQLPADAPPAMVAEAMAARLRAEFSYGLPGQAQSACSLEEFFLRRRGHCEFFASALAIMLRAQHVPCRLVGGFLASERDRDGTVVVRARHAHAWVEVFDRDRGWLTVDPTPAPADGPAAASWFGALLARAEALWTEVTGFDAERRQRALAWFAAAPGRGLSWLGAHPLWSGALLASLVLAWSRRRRRSQKAIAEYRSELRRLRLVLLPGETPRRLLARARGFGLPATALTRLQAATERHERQRYRAADGKVRPAASTVSGHS